MNWVLDLAVVVLVVLVIRYAHKKGFLRSVLSLFGHLVALVFSFVVGKVVADWIYEAMVKSWLVQTVETNIVAGTNNNLTAAVDRMYSDLPGLLSGMFNFLFGSKEKVLDSLQTSMESTSSSVTDAIVTMLKPMLLTLLGILIILLLVVVCLFVLRVLDKVLIRVRRLPLIGSLDGLLGGVVGIFQALLWLIVLAFFVKALILLSSNNWSLLNTEVIESTILFKHLYYFDLTAFISGVRF